MDRLQRRVQAVGRPKNRASPDQPLDAGEPAEAAWGRIVELALSEWGFGPVEAFYDGPNAWSERGLTRPRVLDLLDAYRVRRANDAHVLGAVIGASQSKDPRKALGALHKALSEPPESTKPKRKPFWER